MSQDDALSMLLTIFYYKYTILIMGILFLLLPNHYNLSLSSYGCYLSLAPPSTSH